MKYSNLIIFLLLNISCSQSQSKSEPVIEVSKVSILPIEFTIEAQFRQVKDVGLLIPSVHFSIDENNVEVRVGANEIYNIQDKSTVLRSILSLFKIDDFKSNQYFYHPYLKEMGYLETRKRIEGKEYIRKFSSYKRRDIKDNYLDLDSIEISKFKMLSDYLNQIAIDILQEDIDKESMIVASSMSEALKNPKKVYKLNLRNSRTAALSPEIGKLINLRVLDFSGSKIKSIPPEIENCIHLKSIIANASSLSEIPPSIGNLKKLRDINFGYCKIKKLPEEFGKLESLWNLSLGSNQLRSLPNTISNLKNLQMLSIAKNNFDTFPLEVLGLECVGNLWMHGNSFKHIPIKIVNLKKLQMFLVLSHN